MQVSKPGNPVCSGFPWSREEQDERMPILHLYSYFPFLVAGSIWNFPGCAAFAPTLRKEQWPCFLRGLQCFLLALCLAAGASPGPWAAKGGTCRAEAWGSLSQLPVLSLNSHRNKAWLALTLCFPLSVLRLPPRILLGQRGGESK